MDGIRVDNSFGLGPENFMSLFSVRDASGMGASALDDINPEFERCDVALVIGISPAGIDFKAVDGMLCHIIVLFIGPAAQPDKHHKVLSRFTHLLSDGELRSALIESQTVDNVIEILAGWDREDDEEGL